jgi:Flp pilus assembly protein TadG
MNPRSPIRRNSRRNRRRSGTGMLEIAFLLMPTFAILGGFVDIGMVVFTWATLQNAVREGTRYAITYQVDSSNHQITSIKNRVSQTAMGMVSASADSTTGTNVPYVQVNFYTQPTASNPNGTLVTGTNSNASGNIVEVSIQNYPYALMAPFSGSLSAVTSTAFYATPGTTWRVQAYSADVLGGTPAGGAPTP